MHKYRQQNGTSFSLSLLHWRKRKLPKNLLTLSSFFMFLLRSVVLGRMLVWLSRASDCFSLKYTAKSTFQSRRGTCLEWFSSTRMFDPVENDNIDGNVIPNEWRKFCKTAMNLRLMWPVTQTGQFSQKTVQDQELSL